MAQAVPRQEKSRTGRSVYGFFLGMKICQSGNGGV